VTPGSPAAEPPKPAIADPEVTTGPEPQTPLTESACEPHREHIEAGLARGRNAMSIWQTMVDQHGFAGGYQSVKRFVSKLKSLRHHRNRARRGSASRRWHRPYGP